MKNSPPLGSEFSQLDPAAFVADRELIHALDPRSTPVPCKSERVLFRQDEPTVGVFIVHKGAVTLSMMSEDGHSLIAAQARPSSLLGLSGVIGNHPYAITANAGAGAKVSFVSRDDLNALMQADPALSVKILDTLAAEIHSTRKTP